MALRAAAALAALAFVALCLASGAASADDDSLYLRVITTPNAVAPNETFTLRLEVYVWAVPTDLDALFVSQCCPRFEVVMHNVSTGVYEVILAAMPRSPTASAVSGSINATLGGRSELQTWYVVLNDAPRGASPRIHLDTNITSGPVTTWGFAPGQTVWWNATTTVEGQPVDVGPINFSLKIFAGRDPRREPDPRPVVGNWSPPSQRLGPGLYGTSFVLPDEITITTSFDLTTQLGNGSGALILRHGFHLDPFTVIAYAMNVTNTSADLTILVGNETAPFAHAAVGFQWLTDFWYGAPVPLVDPPSIETDAKGFARTRLHYEGHGTLYLAIEVIVGGRLSGITMTLRDSCSADCQGGHPWDGSTGFLVQSEESFLFSEPGTSLEAALRLTWSGTLLANTSVAVLAVHAEVPGFVFAGNITTDGSGIARIVIPSTEQPPYGALQVSLWAPDGSKSGYTFYLYVYRSFSPKVQITAAPSRAGEPFHVHAETQLNFSGAELYVIATVFPGALDTSLPPTPSPWFASPRYASTAPYSYEVYLNATPTGGFDGDLVVPDWFPDDNYTISVTFIGVWNATEERVFYDQAFAATHVNASSRAFLEPPPPKMQGTTQNSTPGPGALAALVAVAAAAGVARAARRR